jgi:glycosyltransferase involved in cell wall biosynthesis
MTDDCTTVGRLNGKTILRYAHAYEAGGGVEQYLSDLNRTLLERNRMTIIQVQLTSDPERVGEVQREIGIGRFVRVARLAPVGFHERAIPCSNLRCAAADRCKQWVIDHMLFSRPLYPWLSRPWLQNRLSRRCVGGPADAGDVLRSLYERFSPDLICLHITGTADTAEVLDTADACRIPAVAVNHFSNDKLAELDVRNQIRRMAGVACVNAVSVPKFLGAQFVNVSDGIDTEFFRREHTQQPAEASALPIVFLPARFTPTKGHADLLRAVAALKRRGLAVGCVFAGRIDNSEVVNELRVLIRQERLEDNVRFVGELGPAELRDWYGAARVLALPTSSEGLPRILMECQAMGVPPVAYDIGGTSEAIRHGETGFLLRVGDSEGLAASIERLLRDEFLHKRMALAGRAMVERRFSLQGLSERHEDFYARVVDVWRRKKTRLNR